MSVPRWVDQPYSFLRYMLPGFLFIGFAAAFFPHTLTDATRSVGVAANRSDLIALLWLAWAVAIGFVFHSFYTGAYELWLRPRPRGEEIVARVLERAGMPPGHLRRSELKALFAMALTAFGEGPGLSWARREGGRVHMAYQASIVLAITGAFLAVVPDNGPLVSQHWPAFQGAAFVVGAGALAALYARPRDTIVRQVEVASVPWDGEKTAGALVGWAANLLRAKGEALAPAPVPPPSPR